MDQKTSQAQEMKKMMQKILQNNKVLCLFAVRRVTVDKALKRWSVMFRIAYL